MESNQAMTSKKSFGTSWWWQDNGTVLESSVVMLILFFLIVGLIDVGRGVWVYNSLSAAAREASRYAIVHGNRSSSPATSTTVENYVENKLPGIAPVTVNTTWIPDNSDGSSVRVTVQYDYQPVVALFFPVQLSATSEMAISY